MGKVVECSTTFVSLWGKNKQRINSLSASIARVFKTINKIDAKKEKARRRALVFTHEEEWIKSLWKQGILQSSRFLFCIQQTHQQHRGCKSKAQQSDSDLRDECHSGKTLLNLTLHNLLTRLHHEYGPGVCITTVTWTFLTAGVTAHCRRKQRSNV